MYVTSAQVRSTRKNHHRTPLCFPSNTTCNCNVPVTESNMRIDGLCQQVPKYVSIFCFGAQKPSTNGCPLFLPVDHVISSGKYFSLLRVHRGFRQACSLCFCITVIFSSRASSASKHPSLRIKKINNNIIIMIMIMIIMN